MPPSNHDGVAGDAKSSSVAMPAPLNFRTSPSDASDIAASGDASVAGITAVADDLAYTLTVGQALEFFVVARRKPPSQRSIQRYCIEGRLAAQKIRTSYGAEWLINESSLARLIEAEPVVSGVASDAKSHRNFERQGRRR